MMINKYDIISNSTSVVTATYSVANLKETLSIIILVISILNILVNCIIKIASAIKQKQYENIAIELEDAKNELERINDTLEEKGKEEKKC